MREKAEEVIRLFQNLPRKETSKQLDKLFLDLPKVRQEQCDIKSRRHRGYQARETFQSEPALLLIGWDCRERIKRGKVENVNNNMFFLGIQGISTYHISQLEAKAFQLVSSGWHSCLNKLKPELD